MAQSTIFPIFIRSEYKDDGAFRGFQSDAARAAAAAKREFQGVSAALDQALSRPRNSTGSLDLGVDELRKAAAAQAQVAAAAREVAEATKRAAQGNGAFDASLSRATRSAFEYANAQERASAEMLQQVAALDRVQAELNQVASATNAVTAASLRGNAARGAATGSVRAERAAFTQLGQQLQDSTVQLQMGTSALTVFSQQVPQASFALMGLADSANATKRAIGQTATFLAGPWGAAIFAAIAVLGPFVAKLFETQKAADLALDATKSLAEQQADFANFFDLATGAILEQNSALIANARLKRLDAIEANNAKIKANRAQILDTVADSSRGVVITGGTVPGTFQSRIIPGSRDIKEALARAGKDQAAISRELSQIAESGGDSAADAKRIIALRAEREQLFREVRRLTLEAESLETGQLQAGLKKPERSRRARAGGSTGAQARELAQLQDLAEGAAESIARINERFDESPRLIDQASQATRQLDEIIADLSEKKPLNFEKMVADAQAAKSTIEAALVRPIEEIREQSEQRLQIEQALAQGRTDEAQALTEIFRLRQTTGKVTADQADEVREIVRLEQERIRYLQDQQRLFAAQLDVVDQVQRSLTDLLSGRSTDFFGDFRQALRDLQGQRIFEDLFGDAFRDIRTELQGGTPQGRANAAYTAEVEKTASTTAILEESLFALASTASGVSARMAAIATGRAADAANDNGAMGEITVRANRNRPQEVRIARMSVMELADRLGQSIGAGIGAELEPLLGERFATLFGEIAGGIIAGKVTGGDVGAVLGGATKLFESGILGNDNRISAVFGKASEGAAQGTQIDGIIKALGIRGSKTGAQIGGAIGSVIPIPGAAQVGAALGSIIGGLIKGVPRGSATIGATGGGLGITSIVGNRGSLRDAAGGLGNSVLETVNRIAQQLGASINASAGSVSIGQRKDNLRVDTTGRGITKIGNGAVDFGQDAEAAIAFAVRDLIQDGVITGLKASEQRLLRAGGDIEQALRDVLDFRSVFDQLDEIRDPIGSAVRRVNRDFERTIDLFNRAGASTEELADLEDLYAIRRAQAIEDVTSRVVGSLQGLLDSLRIGDSGLSLRTRRSNATSEFDALAARVAAGDSSAFDDFAEVSQQLLDIERQLFGSSQAYFDRLAQITALTERAIADQTNVTSIGAGIPSPFDDQASVTRAIEATGAEQVGWLRAINQNLIALAPGAPSIAGGGGGSRDGVGPFPSLVANF